MSAFPCARTQHRQLARNFKTIAIAADPPPPRLMPGEADLPDDEEPHYTGRDIGLVRRDEPRGQGGAGCHNPRTPRPWRFGLKPIGSGWGTSLPRRLIEAKREKIALHDPIGRHNSLAGLDARISTVLAVQTMHDVVATELRPIEATGYTRGYEACEKTSAVVIQERVKKLIASGCRHYRRQWQGCDPDEPYDPLKCAIWAALVPFQEELLATGGVTFMGLRNSIVEAVRSFAIASQRDALAPHADRARAGGTGRHRFRTTRALKDDRVLFTCRLPCVHAQDTPWGDVRVIWRQTPCSRTAGTRWRCDPETLNERPLRRIQDGHGGLSRLLPALHRKPVVDFDNFEQALGSLRTYGSSRIPRRRSEREKDRGARLALRARKSRSTVFRRRPGSPRATDGEFSLTRSLRSSGTGDDPARARITKARRFIANALLQ